MWFKAELSLGSEEIVKRMVKKEDYLKGTNMYRFYSWRKKTKLNGMCLIVNYWPTTMNVEWVRKKVELVGSTLHFTQQYNRHGDREQTQRYESSCRKVHRPTTATSHCICFLFPCLQRVNVVCNAALNQPSPLGTKERFIYVYNLLLQKQREAINFICEFLQDINMVALRSKRCLQTHFGDCFTLIYFFALRSISS